ncbi:hypothetical protein ACFV1L_00285 [Kitasatospora sp. NPDC059646]|uniref:hypothetical protein n=1 Tax=Kitasatospora sp. NPDC059646 TaxID=3346893 RepID=UPI0036D04727
MRIRLGALHPGPPLLAEADTPYGRAVARWRGGPADPPGDRTVEWTVDEDRAAVRPADRPGPEVRAEGELLVLIGDFDGDGVLRLGDTPILLDLPGRPPGPLELTVPREHVELHPYDV